MTNLAKETATTPQKWFVVEKTFFQTAPKVIKRTELQHEYSEFWGRVGQMFTQVVVVVFLHLYLGYAEAALIQAGLNVCCHILLDIRNRGYCGLCTDSILYGSSRNVYPTH